MAISFATGDQSSREEVKWSNPDHNVERPLSGSEFGDAKVRAGSI
jgi:hypothetical protein